MSIGQSGGPVVAAAREWLGTPYVHQASTIRQGCDCLGLIRGVWRSLIGDEPQKIPGYSPDWGEASGKETMLEAAREHFIELDLGALEAGNILVFRWHAQSVAKHAGILTGQNTFIHAYDQSGVVETTLGRFWRKRIEAMFQFPAKKLQ